ncbi:MAG: hypothetical protein MR274_04060 [Clostridium sp.]|nr:hypothetical protein [Clostridium sp.]
MGMPNLYPSNDISLDAALNNIIQSVALMEAALSHILNAEGEKLQAVLGTAKVANLAYTPTKPEDLLKFNSSVEEMITSATLLEVLLTKKLTLAKSMLPQKPKPKDKDEDEEVTTP